jgi:chorismate mutase
MSDQIQDLHARRRELAERVATLHWDLGGLTYEMAIRDHFRLDVIVRKAAELQEADAELGEVERLLAAAEQGVSGQCRACGAVHSRGAAYCWRCGQPLMLEARSTLVGAAVVPPATVAPPAPDAPTARMPPVSDPSPSRDRA